MISMPTKKGFTLIELLVVIAIIALLMSVLIPSLNKAKESARLVLCANNQKQTLTGLFAYAADNDAVYPPHPAERPNGSFSVVNYLNYHQGPGKGGAAHEGTYYYLGQYLPLVDVFVCPLGRAKDNSELQRQYVDYKVTTPTYSGEGTLTSYNLYWGGYKFLSGIYGGAEFIGPTGKGTKGENNLLLSDCIFNWGRIVSRPEWWLSHKPSKGSGQFQDYDSDPIFGNYCAEYWIYEPASTITGPLPAEMQEMKMNAAYTDGSVVRYSGANTSIVWTTDNYYYIPKKWR